MQATLADSSSTKEVNLTITEADVGTLYIIQHELLKSDDIKFAGVVVKHPLTGEYSMRVNSSKNTAKKEIERSVDSAIKYTQELKDLVKSTTKGS